MDTLRGLYLELRETLEALAGDVAGGQQEAARRLLAATREQLDAHKTLLEGGCRLIAAVSRYNSPKPQPCKRLPIPLPDAAMRVAVLLATAYPCTVGGPTAPTLIPLIFFNGLNYLQVGSPHFIDFAV